MAAEGKPVADLDTRVEPAPHLLFQWNAFSQLSPDRSAGFGLGAIPWTAIDRYAQRHGVDDPDEFERFVRLIRLLDRVFLDWHADKKD